MTLLDAGKDLLQRAGSGLGLVDDAETPEEKKCREFMEKLYQNAQGTLTPVFVQWYQEIMFVLGEHYADYNARLSRFVARPERSHVPREISNLVIDYAERAVSYLGKSNAVGHVVPEGVSSADYQKAKTAEHIRKQLWDDDLMDQKLRIGNSWCVFTGNGIYLTGLDAVNKPVVGIPKMVPVVDPDTGMPMIDEEGQARMMPDPSGAIDKLVPLTEVSTEPVNPMEIVPDPYAKNPWDMRYWLHHSAVDLDVLADEFGTDAVKGVAPDRELWSSYQYQNKLMDLVTRFSQSGQNYALTSAVADTRLENSAVRKTFFRLPSRNYPEGELLVRAGGKTLHYGKYPFVNSDGKAFRNIHWYGWSLAPGCLWRFGLVRNLIMPQRRMNGMFTQASLNRKIMGNAQWLVPDGCKFDDEASSKPGAVFKWKPNPKLRGAKPERQPGIPMTPDFWREFEITVEHMDRISGFNDVLRGENPTGVTAGVSLNLLSEQASGRFDPPIKEMRREIKSMEETRLFMVGMSGAWAKGKKFFIRDEDGIGDVIELSNLDAPSDPQIEMEESSTMLWTQAAKKQGVQTMLETGLIDLSLPENRRLVRDILGSGDFKDKESADVILAEWENQQMAKGLAVKPRPLENSAIHMPIHRRVTLKPNYPGLPEDVRTLFELHISQTQDSISEMAQLQQATTAPGPDVTPPGGAPAGPGGIPPSPTDQEGEAPFPAEGAPA
jgi:hypothetical protein